MKQRGMRAGLTVLFVILFNVIFFVLGGSRHPASVWISYGMIHMAWLCLAATPFLFGKNEHVVSGLSIYAISGVYFLVEFVVGLIFILVAPEHAKAALIVQLLFFGVYLAALITVLLANDHTAELTQQRSDAAADIRSLNRRARDLADRLEDETANREIRRVCDQLSALPLGRANQAWSPETLSALSALEEAVKNQDADAAAQSARELQRLLRG